MHPIANAPCTMASTSGVVDAEERMQMSLFEQQRREVSDTGGGFVGLCRPLALHPPPAPSPFALSQRVKAGESTPPHQPLAAKR